MTRTYFTKGEAEGLVGCHIEATGGLPPAPAVTAGTVARAQRSNANDWLVCVEWRMPGKASEYLAMLGDLSFNLPWRAKSVQQELSRDEFERVARVLQPSAK